MRRGCCFDSMHIAEDRVESCSGSLVGFPSSTEDLILAAPVEQVGFCLFILFEKSHTETAGEINSVCTPSQCSQ